MNRLEVFADRDRLADGAADVLADALSRPRRASLVVPGGTTPGPTYDRLATRDLAWPQITVTPGDERWVDPASPDSNEGMIRRRLLTGKAAAARFFPLKANGASPEADAAAAEAGLRALLPFSAVLVGMGADGHVGSLFPGLAPPAALDPASGTLCIGVDEAGLAPKVPRITLTIAAMRASRLIVLLISGEDKRAVVERVQADEAFSPPVSRLLRQEGTPVRILWAP
ncbi:MAG: 6-phosphogluconolactonase [Caulobacteraceae bacterium]